MTTASTLDRAETFARPAARFVDEDNPVSDTGQALEVRASAAMNCRRSLWYSATGFVPTNPPTEKSLMAMEAGNALEPVMMRAMDREGWKVNPADPRNPQTVTVRLGPGLLVTGHPDGTVRLPLSEGQEDPGDATPQMFLFDDEEEESLPAYGEEKVVEVKTRGPEAFKRWRTLGAERSHPAAVAQAALYTLGQFGEMRDAVIACMDTGSRTWDYEVIPAELLEQALQNTSRWLHLLVGHHALHGPDPDALPNRDFSAGSWQCRSCPFLDICLPGDDHPSEVEEPEESPVSDEEALEAVAAYSEAKQSMKDPEKTKKTALATLKKWMRRKGDTKVSLGGRTISLVQSRRYSVNYNRLNSLLDPETRTEIVTERESEYVRVS